MRRTWVVVLAGAMLAACSSGGDSADDSAAESGSAASAESTAAETGDGATDESSTPDSTQAPTTTVAATTTTTTTVPEPVGDASTIEDSVELRSGTAADFASLSSPTPVAVGDLIRTDTTGYGEVAYFDGSRTRIDVDTEFEILELVNEPGNSSARTRMGLGRTWHRVESLGEGDAGFSVETSVATAVVRGTAFVIECTSDTECRFLVIEGTVDVVLADGTVITLEAPSSLTVDALDDTADPTPVPLPFEGAFADPWLLDNAERDVTQGNPTAAETFQTYGPAYGSLSGTFSGVRTIDANSCTAVCLPDMAPVGDVADRTYTFEIDCSGGVPCIGTVDTEYRSNNQVLSKVIPLTFDGTTYTWELAYSSPSCYYDDGTTNGNVDTVITWAMTPTAGEIVGDAWVVSAMTGSADAENTVTDVGGCTDGWLGDSSLGSVEVTRSA